MNIIFFLLIIIGFITAAFKTLATGSFAQPEAMALLSKGIIETASGAVTLALGLIGAMALFLGLMKVVEKGGGLQTIARLIRPLMRRLFPDVPSEHPAMGAMIMNMAANILGLGNAATPFGIRAMRELDKLNPRPGEATDAMALFLAINTSSVTLLPTGMIAIRMSLDSSDPAAIVPTTLFATICSTLAAIMATRFLSKRAAFAPTPMDKETHKRPDPSPQREVSEDHVETPTLPDYARWVYYVVGIGFCAFFAITIIWGKEISHWIVPLLIVSFLSFGLLRRVRIYEAFVEGAREGFDVAVKIIPYLVAILVAVGIFRQSGALDIIIQAISPVMSWLGMPAEALPMALLRPLSGSGAYGVAVSILQDPAIGPDHLTGILVSTIQGSTETTFYVLAVYFGAVGVRKVRHALFAALIADLTGVIAATFICNVMYG
ncbi:nucleoside recognition domain-containing protein [Magnetococcales bacterium HHB-1]